MTTRRPPVLDRITRVLSPAKIYPYLVLAVFVLKLLSPNDTIYAQVCSTIPVEIGYRDFKFQSVDVTSDPTESKPESKLWYNDGFWWGIMWSPDSLHFRIHRLDLPNQCWINVGPNVDDRPRSATDVLLDGTKLYIVSRAKMNHKSIHGPQAARFYRFSYDPATKTYSLDTGFPVEINSRKSESLTIAKDSTGKIWAVWNQDKDIKVNRTLGDDLIWGQPFDFPAQQTQTLPDDIAAVTAFGGNKIGVMWSHQPDQKTYFSVHTDGQPDQTWGAREEALADPSLGAVSDDHLNFAPSFSDGSLFAVTKTQLTTDDDPKIFLLKRDESGLWTRSIFGIGSDRFTRPIALINSDTDSIYVFAQGSPNASHTPAHIYMKRAHIANPVFPPGLGTPVIMSDSDDQVNNVTSTKQWVTNESGILLLASDSDTKWYLHNHIPLTGTGTNASPLAFDDAATTSEDTAFPIDVLVNDSDPDGSIDATTVSVVSQPSSGTLSVNPLTGVTSYTPGANFSGVDIFTYRVNDNQGAVSNEAIVTVTVAEVNDPPVAAPDSAMTGNNSTVSIPVLGNDLDIDGVIELTSVTLVGLPANGSASVNTVTGEIVYAPQPGFFGVDMLTYQVYDNDGSASNLTPVKITVLAAPTAVADSVLATKETSVAVDILANDSDPDGVLVASSVAIVAAPLNGSVTVNQTTGALNYLPAPGFLGTDSLKYTVDDDDGLTSNAATVSFRVTGPPVAVNDLVVTLVGTSVEKDVLANDFDLDGSALAIGSLRVTFGPFNGNISIDSQTGIITYAPAAGFSGTDVMGYTVEDVDGNLSNEATVTIRVNEKPVAAADAATVDEDTGILLDLTANDTDSDGFVVDSTLTVVVNPTQGTVDLSSGNGMVRYLPNPNYVGNDSFAYTVRDNDGTVSNAATVSLTVNPVNDPPAVANDFATTSEEVEIEIDVLANDTDVDGSVDASTLSLASVPVHGTVFVDPSTGALTYMPNLDFFGVDSLTYTVNDDVGATSSPGLVQITVLNVNDAPVAIRDTATTNQDAEVEIFIGVNDVDIDGTLDLSSISVTVPPFAGVVTLNGGSGSISYSPNAGFAGTDSLAYKIADDLGAFSNEATVVVRVKGPPVAVDDTVYTNRDGAIPIDVLQNDFDPDGGVLLPGSVTKIIGPFNGTASVDPLNGVITYTPNTNFSGSDLLTYTVADDDGFSSNEATVTILVDVNAPPNAGNDVAETDEDTSVVVDVLANDTDSDGTINPATVAIQAQPANGIASVNPATGAVTYSPAPNFFGNDQFSYRVSDDEGTPSSPATVSITVRSINDAPVAANDTVSTLEDTAIPIAVLNNDFDGDGLLQASTVAVAVQPANGMASLDPSTGEITYLPNLDFAGTDSFSYDVADDSAAVSNEAFVVIAVVAKNDAPIAVNDTVITSEDTDVGIAVTSNDTDVDGSVDVTSVAITVSAVNGSTSIDPASGDVTYSPNLNFSGMDSFQYTINDDGGATSNPATVSISVTAVNDPPVAENDSAQTAGIVPVEIAVLANDGDPDGTIVSSSIAVTGSPANGVANVNSGSGTITYTANLGFVGTDTLTYTVNDDAGATSNAATVSVIVSPANASPVAVDDSASTQENVAVEIDVLDNDNDSDGTLAAATVTVVNGPLNGSASVNSSNGNITYAPNPGFSGNDNFSYTVQDNAGAGSNAATVRVAVIGSGGGEPATISFSPTSDGQVKLSEPGSNYGSKSTAKVEQGKFQTYFKFQVSGLSSNVISAVLRLRVADGVSDGGGNGGSLYSVSNNLAGTTTPWHEATLTSGNAPGISGQAVSTVGAVQPNEFVDFDVRAVIQSDGAYSFGLVGNSTNQVKYYTKEGTTAPELIIELSGSGSGGNTPPVAVDDSGSTPENVSLVMNILANDTDSDGILDVRTVFVVDAPVHGNVVVNPNSGLVTYTPVFGFSGVDRFTYTVKDDAGAISNIATVTVSVGSANIPPVAVDDNAAMVADSSVEIAVLSNDSDSDGVIDVGSVVITSGPSNGAAVASLATGNITYTPNSGFVGTDTFDYTVKDDAGATSNAATVSVDVSPGNSPPIAVDDAATTNEAQAVEVAVLSNDSDSDGTLVASSVSLVAGPTNGAVTVSDLNGNVTYIPDVGFTGVDTFAYTVMDDAGAESNQATVSITVISGGGSATTLRFTPVADGQVKLTAPGNNYGFKTTSKVEQDKFASYYKFDVTGLSGNVTSAVLRLRVGDGAFDGSDSGGSLYSVSNNFRGTSTAWNEAGLAAGNAPIITGAPVNSVGAVQANMFVDFDVSSVVQANGTYSFGLAGNSVDQVKYYTKEGTSAPELVIEIASGGGNTPPVAVDDAATTNEDSPVEIAVLSNDSDSDGVLDAGTVTVVSSPLNGSVSVNANNGNITYTPNTGFSGDDSFGYTVQDDGGATSGEAIVAVTVVGTGGGVTTLHFTSISDGQVKLTEPGRNYGTKSTSKVELDKFTSYYKFDINGLIGNVVSAILRLRVADGAFDGGDNGGTVYSVSNNYFGTTTPWDEGSLTSGNAPAIGGAPVNTVGSVQPNTFVDFDVSTVIQGEGIYSLGLVGNSGNQVKYYTREGINPPELLIMVSSGSGGGNVPPLAADDSGITPENASLVMNILANDNDSDGTLDVTSVALQVPAGNGNVTINPNSGVVTYAPAIGFSGVDSFTYTVDDNEGATSNIATVTITVSGNTGGEPVSLSFQSVQDGQVKLSEPASNYGGKSTTKVEANKFVTYLKFNVSGITGSVQQARIRLKVTDGINDGSADGGSIYLVSNNFSGSTSAWNEDALTAGNAPQVTGTALFSAGAVQVNELVELDITPAITGDGIYSFAIVGNSGDQAKYFTHEGVAPPEVVVDYLPATSAENETPELLQEEVAEINGEEETIIPDAISLLPNYPNPFNAETSIEYTLPEAARVEIDIYNTKGQEVRQLVHDVLEPGFKKVTWDGRDNRGIAIASGLYLVRLKVAQKILTMKVTLQK